MTKVIKEARNGGGRRELAVLLLSVSVLCASGFAEVIYENDFAERHSTGLIAGRTHAVYPASTVVSNVVSATIYPAPDGADAIGTDVVPARVGGSIPEPVGRDGWRRLLPTSTGESVSACVLKNWGTNTCIRNEYESRHVGLAQHFGSVVSNGTLRMMVDMRLPANFGGDIERDNFRLAVSLGNDTLYDGYRDACLAGRILHVGVDYGKHPRYLDVNGTAQVGTETLNMSTWYRVEVTVHLDANPKTFDYVLYEQSSNPPSLNDATGTQVFAVSNVGGMNGVDTLSTFAVWSLQTVGNYDNIRIWHTPPGAAHETLLYQNSFNTRVVWTKAAVLTDGAHNEAAALDGWKSLRTGFRDGLVFGEANNPAMSIYGNVDSVFDGASGYVGQPIGEKLTVGEVTAQVDIRPPYGWLTSGGNAWFRLGGDGHLVPASGTEFLKPIACGFGFNASSNNSWHEGFFTNCVIVAYQGDRNGGGQIVSASVPVVKSHWYRFVSTIRMKDSAYDVAVYDMGEDWPTLATPTPATPVTTFTNLPFRTANATLGGISSVSLTAITIQPNLIDPKYPPLFDNIRIERKVGGVTIIFR